MTSEDILVGLFMTVFFVLLIGGTITVGLWLNVTKCNAQFADFEHRWGVWEGCMLKTDGKWIPDERYRVLEE